MYICNLNIHTMKHYIELLGALVLGVLLVLSLPLLLLNEVPTIAEG